MPKSNETIFFSMGEISLWRVFQYDFQALTSFRDENVRGYLKLVAWITFISCLPVIIVAFSIDFNHPKEKIFSYLGLLMPPVTLALIFAYTLPLKNLYWMIILPILGATSSAINISSVADGIYSSTLLPITAMMLFSVAFTSPFFPRTAFFSIIALWIAMATAYFTIFTHSHTMEAAWQMFNVLFGLLIVVLLGIRTLLKDMSVALGLQEEQIEDLTQTNALLNITLNHNDFGLAGFDTNETLVMQRGAKIDRLFSSQRSQTHFDSLKKVKQALQPEVNFEAMKNDYVEYQLGERHFLLRIYDIKSMTIFSHMEVTHLREVEAELRARQKLSVIGEITSGVAHNYNNALAIALSNLEAVPIKGNEHIVNEYIEPSIRAIERSSDISHKLLALAGRQNLKLEVFDVSKILENMSNLIRSAIGSDVNVSIVVEPSLHIETDLREFETAILNLLINSRNALTEGDGKIIVSAKRTENYVMVTVEDNGHGIPQEIAHKIFDPFFSTRATQYSTGLGLSTVKGFVEQSQGKVDMQTSENGTIFELYFPVVHKSMSTHKLISVNSPISHSQSAVNQVLMVDDNEEILQSFERLLKTFGQDVITCSIPLESIKIYENNPQIRHVFLDLTMPELNGIELGRRLLEVRPDVSLYLLTGETHAQHFEEARQTGFQEVIIKPASAQHLISLISEPNKKQAQLA